MLRARNKMWTASPLRRAFLLALLPIFFFRPVDAQANSLGSVALTVVISSAVGAALGLSTLPFYEESGEHTRNIWIGAAVGAVVGVGFAAVTALKSTDKIEFEEEYEEADKQDFSQNLRPLPNRRDLIIAPESIALAGRAIHKNSAADSIWAPISTIRF